MEIIDILDSLVPYILTVSNLKKEIIKNFLALGSKMTPHLTNSSLSLENLKNIFILQRIFNILNWNYCLVAFLIIHLIKYQNLMFRGIHHKIINS